MNSFSKLNTCYIHNLLLNKQPTTVGTSAKAIKYIGTFKEYLEVRLQTVRTTDSVKKICSFEIAALLFTYSVWEKVRLDIFF